MQQQSGNRGIEFPFWAIALMLCISLPAGSSELSDREIAADCGECAYTLRWNPQADATYFELHLADPLAQDGRRLAYKGPSTAVRLVVRGTRSALLRSCNAGGCSGFIDVPLIPERDRSPRPGVRFAEPVQFFHELDSPAAPPETEWPSTDHRALSVDISAAGQRLCGPETDDPKWVVGGRMWMQVAPDADLLVVNRQIVEHLDGKWTWTGDISGGHSGVATFTTDACGEALYASIDSNVGQFVVRPSLNGDHVSYRVEPRDRPSDCEVLTGDPRVALFGLDEVVGENVNSDGVRLRTLDFDAEAHARRFSPLVYLAGEDRAYDLGGFVRTSVFVEFFAGEPLALDLHAGEFRADYSGWSWGGCVVGQPGRIVTIQLSWSGETMSIYVRGPGNRFLYLQRNDDGLFDAMEYQP